MQIKTTMRYHYTVARMWRKGNAHALLVGMQADAATVENSMELPQKIKNEVTYHPTISLLGIYAKKLKTPIEKSIFTLVFIYNSQDLKAAQVSISR